MNKHIYGTKTSRLILYIFFCLFLVALTLFSATKLGYKASAEEVNTTDEYIYTPISATAEIPYTLSGKTLYFNADLLNPYTNYCDNALYIQITCSVVNSIPVSVRVKNSAIAVDETINLTVGEYTAYTFAENFGTIDQMINWATKFPFIYEKVANPDYIDPTPTAEPTPTTDLSQLDNLISGSLAGITIGGVLLIIVIIIVLKKIFK